MISWPGTLAAGTIVDEPLHIVDLYPTLLRLAGASLEQKQPLDGRDAWPTIAKGEPGPHDFILHNVTPWSGALRMGKWKLLHNGDLPPTRRRGPRRTPGSCSTSPPIRTRRPTFRTNTRRYLAELRARLESLREAAAPANIPPNVAPGRLRVPEGLGRSRETG